MVMEQTNGSGIAETLGKNACVLLLAQNIAVPPFIAEMRFAARIPPQNMQICSLLLFASYMCRAMPASLSEMKTNAKCMSKICQR